MAGNDTVVAAVFAWSVITYLYLFGTGMKPLLTMTDKTSWAWEITAMAYMLKVANDNREKVAGCYWAKALVMNGIASFGGGFVGPLAFGHVPAPLMEETFVWMMIVAWYITQQIPSVSRALSGAIQAPLGWAMFSVFWGIFRTHQIVGVMELGYKAVADESALAHSRYFATPVVAPLLGGWLAGIGGQFLPFTNGLGPIEESRGWPIRSAFVMPIIYCTATRFFGWEMLDAKMLLCVIRILGDLCPAAPREKALGHVTKVTYAGTNVRQYNLPLPVVVPLKKSDSASEGEQPWHGA